MRGWGLFCLYKGQPLFASGAKKTHAMMQWQPPRVVGKVFCVGERVKEPQCSKQQLIYFYELYRGTYVFNGSNSLQKNSSNSRKQRPSNVDSDSDGE